MRKYFLTTYTIKVLSEDYPVEDLTPAEVAEAIDTGNCVGLTEASSVEIDGKRAATLLTEFGSEPGYFMLDDEGYDELVDGEDLVPYECLNCGHIARYREFDAYDPDELHCPKCFSTNVRPR